MTEEKDPSRIAESWWSGVKGASGDAAESSPPQDDAAPGADWEALRQSLPPEPVEPVEPPEAAEAKERRRRMMLGGVSLALIGVLGFFVVRSGVRADELGSGLRTVTDAIAGLVNSGDAGPEAEAEEKLPSSAKRARPRKPSAPDAAEVTLQASARDGRPYDDGMAPIEVIDGNRHWFVRPQRRVVHIDVARGVVRAGEPQPPPEVFIQETLHSADATMPADPLWGVVVLRGMVGKDGKIRDLRLVSGPEILVSAAMEVAKRWRYDLRGPQGESVEREAKVTIRFAISTG